MENSRVEPQTTISAHVFGARSAATDLSRNSHRKGFLEVLTGVVDLVCNEKSAYSSRIEIGSECRHQVRAFHQVQDLSQKKATEGEP